MKRPSRAPGRVCVLVSGGADSAALLAHYLKRGKTVYPIYIQSGYRWERAELHWLKHLLRALAGARLKPLTILNSPAGDFSSAARWAFSGRRVPGAKSADEAVELPGRNLLLISTAAIFCAQRDVHTIALGTLKGNPFPDASRDFFLKLEAAISSGLGRPFRIEAPFRTLRKKDLVRKAGALPWHLTFSCLSPSGLKPCGHCNKCAETRKAFSQLA